MSDQLPTIDASNEVISFRRTTNYPLKTIDSFDTKIFLPLQSHDRSFPPHKKVSWVICDLVEHA